MTSTRAKATESVSRTDDALAAAAKVLAAISETPRLDAELLLVFATGRTRSALLAFPERALEPAGAELFAALLARRASGEPLAYLTEEREFYSVPFFVSQDVLIPRAETELLVELALAAVASVPRAAVLDVGTGSGAIALAIKRVRADVLVTATDRSAAALAVARRNAARLALDVRLVESRWFEKLGGESFDVIVSNPPYVRSADVTGALAFEPRLALDGGTDGLDSYRVLFAEAAMHLDPRRGRLLVEHGWDQRPELVALAQAHGWRVAAAHDDLAGRPRVLVLERSGAS